jgi:dihydroorotase
MPLSTIYHIRQARLLDSRHPQNGQAIDIWTDGQVILAVNEAYKTAADTEVREIDATKYVMTAGFCDLYTTLNEPGNEWHETANALAEAALAGGFSEVLCWPNTSPFVDDATAASAITQTLAQASNGRLNLHIMGLLSERGEGKHMADLFELHVAGVAVFCDGPLGLQDYGLLARCLQYLHLTGKPVIQVPHSQAVALDGVANESPAITHLGLKGIPPLAERLAIASALEVLRYTGGHLHFSPITTAAGVELVRAAKAEGLNLTASTAPHYLWLDDSRLADFDTNYKVIPPLRDEADVLALRQAVADGVIDSFATHHTPLRLEDKEVEFDYATQGMLSLETAFSILYTGLVETKTLTLAQLVEKLVYPARKLLNLPNPSFEVGAPAHLTLLDPTANTIYQPMGLASPSKNWPLFGETLKGVVVNWRKA